METTYKYVHLDRTNLRAEMEQGALEDSVFFIVGEGRPCVVYAYLSRR
jgi:hypothetical protein